MLCLLALASSACADPCEELSERVCKDLGADCEIWRSGVAEDVIPNVPETGRRRFLNDLFKQRMQDKLCRGMGEPENYASYTMTQTRYLVQLKKDPKTAGPAPKLAQLQMGGGMPVWLAYAIMPLSILGMFGYFMFWNRRAKRPQ